MSNVIENTDTIEKTIELKAPIERVWRALTDHREFGKWFCVNIEAPFEAGRPARGMITHPGFEHVVWSVTIKEMKAPELFSFTWNPYAVAADVDYSQETPTLVEFRLKPTSAGTRLTVTETGFDKIPANRRPEAYRMNDGGWTQQVKNIKAHVES
ncbi:MAG: Activator of Hsp90 ATPase 1 family protein [Rhizobium sp.]|nr:Activator of Hsp90 ATPase 1 family protein [Rhizobium sp.]